MPFASLVRLCRALAPRPPAGRSMYWLIILGSADTARLFGGRFLGPAVASTNLRPRHQSRKNLGRETITFPWLGGDGGLDAFYMRLRFPRTCRWLSSCLVPGHGEHPPGQLGDLADIRLKRGAVGPSRIRVPPLLTRPRGTGSDRVDALLFRHFPVPMVRLLKCGFFPPVAPETGRSSLKKNQ